MTKSLDFALRLKHYKDKNTDDPDADATSDRIAPRGRELYQQLEHKSGLISRSGMFLELLPVDQTFDPPVAEAGKAAMQWELYHPLKRYQECRDRMVLGALAASSWLIEIAFNPDIGQFGEIVFREKDPRGFAWAEGFLSPHDIECPWVMDWAWIPTATLRAKKGKPGWKSEALAELKGDPDPNKPKLSQMDNIDRGRDESDEEARTLVVRFWERGVNDKTKRALPGTLEPLAEGLRFLTCGSDEIEGCGWQSPTEEQAGSTYTEEIYANECPECGGDLTRQDAIEQEVDAFRWPGKKKMTMFAPRQLKVLFEDGWPFDIPSVPFIHCVLKPHPAEEEGMSETSTNWTMQTSSDMVLRLMLEQMLFTKPWFVTDRRYEDAGGQPWTWGRNQGVGIMWTGIGNPPPIQAVQGEGIPNGAVQLLQSIQNVFLSNMGRSDVPLAPGDSKDIAVGTIKQLIESGEVPTDHAIERLRRAESIGFTVLYHLIRKTYTPARVVRYQGLDGKWGVLAVHGDALANADVIVTAEPDFSKVKAQELQAIAEFAMLPPHIQYFAAERLNIPREAVARLQQQALAMGQPVPTDLPLPLQRRMGGAFNGSSPQPTNGVAA